MQMNGSIMGWREGGIRWLRLPQRSPVTLGSILGGRQVERQGLRIASTAVRMTVPVPAGAGLHAPVRVAG
jgi:hypothetical protein